MARAGKRKSRDLRLQQRLIAHYSRVAGWMETKPWYRDRAVADIVGSFFPPYPSRILELCCGTGLLLETLSASFPDAAFIGIDISPGVVERARERFAQHHNVSVLQGDWIYELPPTWGHGFDVIVVKNALHLLNNLVNKLKDLRRVSHARTVLIIVETVSPNVDANRFIRRLFQLVDPQHLKQTFFTEGTLVSALDEAGWPVVQSTQKNVKQHIDTEDWLRQKCSDQTALEKARSLLAQTRNLRVREALDFDAELGVPPRHMLRLQFLAQHVLASARVSLDLETSDPVQLQLL